MFRKIWKDFIYTLIIGIVSLFLINQCNRNTSLNDEVLRLNNNICAITDSLTYFTDEYNRINVEKHSYILTQKELKEQIGLLERKNREYITFINTNIGIKDTIELPTYIEREISNEDNIIKEQGTINIDRNNTYGKSSNQFHISIPYSITDSLTTYPATIDVSHNIYVESIMERNNKTGETFVRLVSDYPNIKFNTVDGYVINDVVNKNIKTKRKGIGLSVGPSLSFGYDMMNKKIVPTVGVGLTIGFNYNILQW